MLADLKPADLDPALWRAAMDLSGGAREGWDVSLVWEETPAAFADVAEFFRGEGTSFPDYPLHDLEWSLEAEERCSRTYRCTAAVGQARDGDDELRAPWVVLYVATAKDDPERAFVGSLRRRLPAAVDDAIGRALGALQRIPLFGDLVLAIARGSFDRERSALLTRDASGRWIVEQRIA